LRLEVHERDNWTCVYCQATEKLTCDHVVPVKRGGATTIDNLVTACAPCNSKKQDRDRKQFERELARERKLEAVEEQGRTVQGQSPDKTGQPPDNPDDIPPLEAAINSEAQPIVSAEIVSGAANGGQKDQKERSPAPPKENTIYHSPDLFLVEESRGSESARARGKRCATRLPDDWMPTLTDLAFARSILPEAQVPIEVDSFRDHWHAANGPPSVKRDWSAAFRNWCRKAVKFAANGGGNGRTQANWQGGGHRKLAFELARRRNPDLSGDQVATDFSSGNGSRYS
jgi:hypothetical protein